MFHTVLGVVCILVFSLVFLYRRSGSTVQKDEADSKPVPGPKGRHLIGNLFDFDKNKVQCSLYRWMTKHGKIFKFSILNQEFVVVNDSTLLREIFSKLPERPYSIARDLNHNASGVTWTNSQGSMNVVKRTAWRILRETFTDPRIREMEDEIVDDFITGLIQQSGGVKDMDKVIWRSVAAQLTAEMVGHKPSMDLVDSSLAFFQAITDLFGEGRILLLSLYPWLSRLPGKLKNVVDTYTSAQTHLVQLLDKNARKTYVKGDERGMIHRFITRKEEENAESGVECITDANINGTMIDITAGSLRTVSSSLSMCFLYMLVYPAVRSRLNKEMERIRRVKKMKELVEGDLPYLNAFIMESIRLATIIQVTLTHLVVDDVTIAGFRLRKNANVFGSLFNAHHAAEPWGDPFKLRPERFLDQSGKLLPQSHPVRQAFIPFGVEERACKGIHTSMDKIFKYVSRVLYRCKVVPLEGTPLPSSDPLDIVDLQIPKFSCSFVERM